MAHLVEHVLRKLRAHACYWEGLPEVTVPSAAVTDADTQAWSDEAYARGIQADHHTRGFLGLLAVGALIAATFFGCATAKADSGELVAWATSNGFSGSPQAVILRGSLVCADLAGGDNGEQAARDLWLNTGIQDIGDARLFVIAAVDNLCPQFDHRGATGGSVRA